MVSVCEMSSMETSEALYTMSMEAAEIEGKDRVADPGQSCLRLEVHQTYH